MIKEYTIRNNYLEATFINLGASITKLIDMETGINVILGHHDYETYMSNPGCMNAVIGRHAGRIQDFYLDGNLIELPKTDNPIFQLHGGAKSFMYQYFEVVDVKADTITFAYTSPDGEGGYPGNVDFSITYKLVNNELHLHYHATSDKKTLMNFTNHAYFNLNDDKNIKILNHELYINADYYIELDEKLVPLSKAPVANTPLDFRSYKPIGQDIYANHHMLTYGLGYDLPYLINKTEDLTHVAKVYSPQSGLVLDVFSDQEVVVFYAGCQIDESMLLNDGMKGHQYAGFCLELQGVPNSPNIEEFKNKNIYEPNEVYQQTTIWRISHR